MSRQIMFIRDGGVGERSMVLGTIYDLAAEFKAADYTDYEITGVYALDQMGELKQISVAAAVGAYDENGFAAGQVTVVFPDGARESAHYSVDGNA